VHDLHLDTLKIYLTNATPDQTLDTVKADLAEIAPGNGYTAGGTDINNSYTESGGTGTLVAGTDPITWTATGGPIAQFRYIILYNDTPTSPADPVIAYWDYGGAVNLSETESFSVDWGASVLTIA
jgi:hypothetical protein